MTKITIPHYKLAELKEFNLDFITNSSQDSLHPLMLSISISYNDIKDILWMTTILESYRTEVLNYNHTDSNPKKEYGQYFGMLNFSQKKMKSIFKEIFLLIRNAKNIIDSEEFKIIEEKMGENAKEEWKRLKNIAFSKNQSSPTEKYLSQIRDKVSNHYDKKSNFNKLKARLKSLPSKGYYSIGKDIESTRFYFADMAYEGYRDESQNNHFNTYLKQFHVAVAGLIESYLGLYSRDSHM